MSIISTNSIYNFSVLKENLNLLVRHYPFLNVQTIGSSVLNKDIYVIKLGKGSKKVFYSSSIHANEWITSVLLMKFVEDYCIAYVNNNNLYGHSVCSLFDSCSIYIMPMANPDGVDLVTGNFDTNTFEYEKVLQIANRYPSISFPDGWKANINGVDLKIYQPTHIFDILHFDR